MRQNLTLDLIYASWAQIRAVNFFKKIWRRQLLDIMVTYHVQYQKKLMIQSWEDLVTDGGTNGKTDESDFMGRCPTNVRGPTIKTPEPRQWSRSGVFNVKLNIFRTFF